MKNAEHPVRSARELPQEIPPPRDLWLQIEARLRSQRPSAPRGWRGALPGWRFVAAAALAVLGCALAAGLWWLHGAGGGPHAVASGAVVAREHPDAGANHRGITTVLAQDDAVRRAALLRALNTRLRALPPATQQKVLADLQLIEQSINDIQSALGRDPGNALLHEMLRDTEQDEQRLAATVQEAGVWTQEAGSGPGRTGS